MDKTSFEEIRTESEESDCYCSLCACFIIPLTPNMLNFPHVLFCSVCNHLFHYVPYVASLLAPATFTVPILTCSFILHLYCVLLLILYPHVLYFLISADRFGPATSDTNCTNAIILVAALIRFLPEAKHDRRQLIKQPLFTSACSETTAVTDDFSTAATPLWMKDVYAWLELLSF